MTHFDLVCKHNIKAISFVNNKEHDVRFDEDELCGNDCAASERVLPSSTKHVPLSQ
jgi:hypothetical protein